MDIKISKKIERIIDKVLFLEKKKIFQYGEILLYPSEIHIILFIDEYKENAKNATRIAEKLGVTKGAVSQTLTRLEKKGIISKIKDPFNKNELTLILTDKGKEALKEFRVLQKMRSSGHDNILKNFSESDKHIIFDFLRRFEEMLESLQKKYE